MYRRKAMGIVVLAVVFELSIAGAVDAWAEFCSASYTCSNGTSLSCATSTGATSASCSAGGGSVSCTWTQACPSGGSGGCSQTYATKYVCPHTTQGTE